MAQWLVVTTSLGAIRLRLHPEAAPQTVAHIVRLANSKLFDGAATFYR